MVNLLILLLSFSGLLANDLVEHLSGINAISGHFEMRVFDEDAFELNRSSGEFAFQKPKLFYWNQTQPQLFQVISDGYYLWINDPSIQQVQKRELKQLDESFPLLMLLAQPEKLIEHYHIDKISNTIASTYYLTPQHKTSVEKISIVIKQDQIQQLNMTDHMQIQTQINLIHNHIDSTDLSSKFQFIPPVNSDVIESK